MCILLTTYQLHTVNQCICTRIGHIMVRLRVRINIKIGRLSVLLAYGPRTSTSSGDVGFNMLTARYMATLINALKVLVFFAMTAKRCRAAIYDRRTGTNDDGGAVFSFSTRLIY